MKKQVFVFLGLTFLLTWAAVFGLMALNVPYGDPICMVVFSLCMMFPALCSILTRLICRQGFDEMYLRPQIKRNWKVYLTALLSPALLIGAGVVLYFVLFPFDFDPSMVFLKELLSKQGVPSELAVPLIWGELAFGALFGGFVNLIPAMGEELGWRGYLFPQLCREMSPLKANLLTGLIWGIWHAPMIAMGHNYGTGYPTAPWGGILAMTVFSIVLGSLFSYWTMKTGSAWAAGIGHGAVNAMAAAGFYFSPSAMAGTANPFIGPSAAGIVGGAGLIAASLFCMVKIAKYKKQA